MFLNPFTLGRILGEIGGALPPGVRGILARGILGEFLAME